MWLLVNGRWLRCSAVPAVSVVEHLLYGNSPRLCVCRGFLPFLRTCCPSSPGFTLPLAKLLIEDSCWKTN